MENVEIGGKNAAFNIQNTLQTMVIKVIFREKYMKKKGIELIAAELEEQMGEAEETFEYSNMNIRDGGESVWILCNQEAERAKIRDFLLKKEVTLAIESDGKRFFGKFSSKQEKDKYREANKDGANLFGQKKKDQEAETQVSDEEPQQNSYSTHHQPHNTKKNKMNVDKDKRDKMIADQIDKMMKDGTPMKTVKPHVEL